MFKCENCFQSCSQSPQNWVKSYRPVTYQHIWHQPPRKKPARFTTTGKEIVQELKVCTACYSLLKQKAPLEIKPPAASLDKMITHVIDPENAP